MPTTWCGLPGMKDESRDTFLPSQPKDWCEFFCACHQPLQKHAEPGTNHTSLPAVPRRYPVLCEITEPCTTTSYLSPPSFSAEISLTEKEPEAPAPPRALPVRNQEYRRGPGTLYLSALWLVAVRCRGAQTPQAQSKAKQIDPP